MRYTTIIDVTEIDDVWRNKNAVLIYTYLSLKCGYHDNDRDLIRISFRNLSFNLHISISACRHALRILTSHGLLKFEPRTSTWRVTKWVQEQEISKRKSKRNAQLEQQEELRKQEQTEREAKQAADKAALNGMTSYEAYISRLKEKAAAGDMAAKKRLDQLAKKN